MAVFNFIKDQMTDELGVLNANFSSRLGTDDVEEEQVEVEEKVEEEE